MKKVFSYNIIIIFCLFFAENTFCSMSDKEFFQSLNTDYPGMEGVKAALNSNDTLLAKSELLLYYQNRTGVNYFELNPGGSTSNADDNCNHYFTVTSIRKYAGQSDGTIDWTISDPNDNEWHYQFHRMYWITNLGKVYANTGNEVYAAEWVSELLDWINDNLPGYPRTLDTGIRLRNWVESYQYFVSEYQSTSVNANYNTEILKSLLAQCRFLRDNWRSNGNWGASETRGLGSVVTMFPEFKFTPDDTWEWWRDLVISRLQHHLTNDFSSDGVQNETSPSYHCIEYRDLFLAEQLMDINGIEISDDLISLFVKPLEFIMHIHKPDGYLPQLSDTDRKNYLSYLKDGAELFNRDDMLYAATKGNEGVSPTSTLGAFPDGGYFVMRSDWGENQPDYKNSNYLVFDTGSNKPWHAHYDILNFEAYAGGYLMIRDAGRYKYTAGIWRDYFKSTAAHNTIVIDNKNQKENISGLTDYWNALPGFIFVEGSHNAYTGLTVKRSIFFAQPDYWIISDKITGSGTHDYDLYFHLDDLYKRHTTLNSLTHSVTTPHFGLYPSTTSAAAEIIIGWVSDKYNVKGEATVAKYSKTGEPPLTFETVLFPFTSGVSVVNVEKEEVFDGDNLVDSTDAFCLKINYGNREDWFYKSESDTILLEYGRFTSRSKLTFVKFSSDSTITNYQFIKGTELNYKNKLLIDTKGVSSNISKFNNAVYIHSEDLKYAKVWTPQTDSLILNGTRTSFTQVGEYLIYDSATGIEYSNDNLVFDQFDLKQNYPNPFNPSTTIKYSIPNVERGYASSLHSVTLKVYDILGREVASLVNSEQSPGNYKVVFDGSKLSNGIYYTTLIASGYVKTIKMILLK